MLRSRRVGRVVTLAVTSSVTVLVLGLSSCGSTGPRISAGKGPTIIHLTSGQNSGRATLPAAASVDGMMRPFGDVTYVFDGAFPDLGATAGSWSFAGGAQPDLSRVAAMAKALGVNGDVRTLPTDQGGGWAVGPNDGTASTFVVSADGLLTWWYSSAASTTGYGCAGASSGSVATTAAPPPSTAIASPPDQPVPTPTMIVDGGPGQGGTYPTTSIVLPAPEPCLPPPAPQGVLDKAMAEARAKALMSQMGIDAAKYQLTTYADPYSASVAGQLLIDGKPSQISFSVGFGAEGAITYASGQLAEPQAGDVYPIVSGDIAVQRLNDHSGKWQFFGSPGVRNMGGVATDAIATSGGRVSNVATSIASSGVNVGVAPGAPATIVDPAITPMPSCVAAATTTPSSDAQNIAASPCFPPVDVCGNIEPVAPNDATNSSPAPTPSGIACTVPAPQPVTVHLNSVKASLTMVWAQDGAVWLLPAYTFTSTDGSEYTVVAVDEQYLDMPAATVDTTVPPPATTTLGEPTPAPSTTEAELSAPSVADAGKVLVGLTVDEATKVALSNGWQLRVVEVDGVSNVITADYQVNRVDVAVSSGTVTTVKFIG
jgi:hypothetical protein